MKKSKFIFTVSFISMLAVVQTANADVASKGYVDDIVGAISTDVEVSVGGTGNVVTGISANGNAITATKGITAEETANKVNTIRDSATATDISYPSEKAVATALETKQDKIDGEVLINTATAEGSLSTGGATPTNVANTIAIGSGASVTWDGVVIGSGASGSGVIVGKGATGGEVSIGNNASGQGTNVGSSSTTSNPASVAFGYNAQAGNYSTSLGTFTQTADHAIAIGNSAKATANYAIQLGTGTNSEANTLSVGLSDSTNYKLLGSDGIIPIERMSADVVKTSATANQTLQGNYVVSGSLSVPTQPMP